MTLLLGGLAAVMVPFASFIAHMSGADFFGLVVSVLVIGYLFYALIRGEKL
jgi:K+-transporting ATPase KdpF subunit